METLVCILSVVVLCYTLPELKKLGKDLKKLYSEYKQKKNNSLLYNNNVKAD